MTDRDRRILLAVGLVVACGLLFTLGILVLGAAGMLPALPQPTPDLAGTLEALISSATPRALQASPTALPEGLSGHIVLTCQIYKFQSSEQICIMNADGSGYHRLTTEDDVRRFYPSLAPDGQTVVYSQYREDNVYEIYELTLADGVAKRLTDRLGVLTAPEISPDGSRIVFVRWSPTPDQYQIWIMNRDGGEPHRVPQASGWDPTWSPDGSQILFAADLDGSNQLYVMNDDGSGRTKLTSVPALRGRSDWSSLDQIVTYSGPSWGRELFLMNSDGSGLHQIGPPGGNSQGPSFSADGRWIAFTAYFDRMNDINGCEIYVIRNDGTDLRRLTDNDYCDYQPRWGP